MIELQVKAQFSSPGPIPAVCLHLQRARGRDKRAQRDKEHLKKKITQDNSHSHHLSCCLLFLRHAPALRAVYPLGCTPQGSPQVGNCESRSKPLGFPLLSQKQDLHPCEQEISSRPQISFSPAPRQRGLWGPPLPHPGASVQHQNQKLLWVWAR